MDVEGFDGSGKNCVLTDYRNSNLSSVGVKGTRN